MKKPTVKGRLFYLYISLFIRRMLPLDDSDYSAGAVNERPANSVSIM